MSWTCPKCSRKFSTERHYHSCEVFSLNDHLKKCTPEIKKLAQDLIKIIQSFKNTQITPLKSMIVVSAGTNFSAIKTRKDYLDIELILPDNRNEFPVYKTIKYGRNKIVHYIKIDSKEDLNKQFLGWLKEAYKSVSKK